MCAGGDCLSVLIVYCCFGVVRGSLRFALCTFFVCSFFLLCSFALCSVVRCVLRVVCGCALFVVRCFLFIVLRLMRVV